MDVRTHSPASASPVRPALLALACGVGVGSIYFPQALTPLISQGLGVGTGRAALVATATQAGYAAGIVALVPLADGRAGRRLPGRLLASAAVALAAAGSAPALPWLVAAAFVAGAAAVVAPVLGALAVGLVEPGRRGAVLGALLSGSVGGMLAARYAGGALGEAVGWRAPYFAAALLAVVAAAVVARGLPRADARGSWVGAVPRPGKFLLQPLRLLATEPDLRRSCIYQALVFGAYQAVWTAMALLLTGPAYGLGAQSVGMVALVGAATMAAVPRAGRAVDRRGPERVGLVCLVGAAAAPAVLSAGVTGGALGLVALIAGALVLDVAMQSGMVANQARALALGTAVRSRLTTAFMGCAFLGGSAGSMMGAQVFARAGWPGVCLLAAAAATTALALHLVYLRPIRAPTAARCPDRPERAAARDRAGRFW